MSFRETSPLGAALYAIEVPPAGGDTLFANMHLAGVQARHAALDDQGVAGAGLYSASLKPR